MPKQSAGLLLYRQRGGNLEVLLVHPGGPFWAKRDDGAWSIPKGEFAENEDALHAAKREFTEETGLPAPAGEYVPLGSAKQASGKIIYTWAVAGDADPVAIRSNQFEMEWPPRSGRTQQFPEVDRAAWFDAPTAQRKLTAGQRGFIQALVAIGR